jgi:serine/threonine protein kinase
MADDEPRSLGNDDTDFGPDAVGPGRDFVTEEPSVEDQLLRHKLKAEMFGTEEDPVKIGRYTVLDKLGEGGMGTVYSARDEELQRTVAIKVLTSEVRSGQARMQREARAMAKLSHPNIVTVHEVASFDDQIYVVMEFVPGLTLRRWLESQHSRAERLEVFLQAARGLMAAHEVGIVHRDFKPENVIVGDDGRVRVLDFGLATAAAEGETSAGEGSPAPDAPGDGQPVSLTQTGQRLGTPAYMAPEQLLGRRTDARSDQFSFCVALYEGLHAQRPFAGETFADISRSVLGGQVLPPPPKTADADLDRIVFRGLSRDPEMRNASMKEVVESLDHALATRPEDPVVVEALAPVVQTTAPSDRATKVKLGLLTVGLGFTALLGQVVFLMQRKGTEFPTILMILVALLIFGLLAAFLAVKRRFR